MLSLVHSANIDMDVLYHVHSHINNRKIDMLC